MLMPKRSPSPSTSGPLAASLPVPSPLMGAWFAGRRMKSKTSAGGAGTTVVAETGSRSWSTETPSGTAGSAMDRGYAPPAPGLSGGVAEPQAAEGRAGQVPHVAGQVGLVGVAV